MRVKRTILIFRILAVAMWVACAILGAVLWAAREQADLAMLGFLAVMVAGVFFGILLWRVHMKTGFEYRGVKCAVAYSWKHKKYYGMAVGKYFEDENEEILQNKLIQAVDNEKRIRDIQ